MANRVFFALLILSLTASVLSADDPLASRLTVSKPFLIDSSVADMRWLSSPKAKEGEAKVIIVRSRKGSVYRSADDGRSWSSLVDALTSDGTSMDQARIASLTVSPASGDMVVLRGFGKLTWYSKDKGANFEKRDASDWSEFQMHPTNPQWIIASKYDGEYPHRDLALYLSQDFGATWKQLVTRIRSCDWGDAGSYGVRQETIYCTIHDAMEKTDFFREWDLNLHFYRSTDFFATQEKLVPHGNRFYFKDFEEHRKYLFVSALNPDDQTEVVLRVSANSGVSFQTAQLPMQLTQSSFTLLDTREGAVFLQVERDGEPNVYADVYVSGPGGSRFSVSLKRVARDWRGTADFEMVKGVEGVYIANVVDDGYTPQKDTAVPKRTVITYDKGSLWSTLPAPPVDSLGKSLNSHCKDCSLHLNGRTNWNFGPMYSAAASTGLVIATGNVGHHVHSREDEVNTYMSRDSGHTWTEVIKGSHIYEVGDHGGLIVLADNLRKTKVVLFSWNEGLNWTRAVFWNHHIEVENIITDPSGTSQVFILYGRRQDKGILVRLDFSTLHQRQCTGMDAPDSEISDYELYRPRGEGSCLLGRQQIITRRKREAACFNGVEFDRAQFVSNCPCAEEDYECDFGFQRAKDNTCERVPDAPPVNKNAPSVCDGIYTVTRGYRRIPGDSCAGGMQDHRDPLEYPCPGVSVVTVLLVIILVGVVFTLGTFTYYKRSTDYYAMPGWLQWIDDTLSAVRYRRFDSQPDSMLDDDDFDLGDEESDAQVLGDKAIMSYTSSKFHGESSSSTSSAAPGISSGTQQQPTTSRVNMDVRVPALRPPPRSRATASDFTEDEFNPGD